MGAPESRRQHRESDGPDSLPNVWSHTDDYQTAYDASGCTREAPSLDLVVRQPRWDKDVSLRFVMLHMVHEYARHNGHADLVREAVDGTVGA